MQLSPLDIRKQEFEHKLRGVDPSEVEAFLEMVANQWSEMQDEQRRLEDRVREMENKLEHYQQVEEALQEALQTARESSQQKLENAERRAEVTIDEAQAKSEEIRRAAENRRDEVQRQVERLISRRSEVVAQMRGFLSSELELLSRFDEDQLDVKTEGGVANDAPSTSTAPGLSVPDGQETVQETAPGAPFAPPSSSNQREDAPEKTDEAGWLVQPAFGEGREQPQAGASEESTGETTLPDETPSAEGAAADQEELRKPSLPEEETEEGDQFGQPPPDELEKIRRILNDLD